MKLINSAKRISLPLKLCAFGLLTGILGGVVGAAFSHLLSFVTHLRESAPWLILLLPLGGVVTVLLYRSFSLGDHGGTNEIILQLKNGSKIRSMAAPLIFVCTAITHLLGGSAGREGAALQLGAAGSSAVSDLLKLRGERRTVFIMSGASALFSSVFGTALTAAFFVLEFKFSRRIFSLALLPCLISSIVAKWCASLLATPEEVFLLSDFGSFSLSDVWRILILAAGLALLSRIMCCAFQQSRLLAKKWVSNPLVRTVIFALLVVVLTACVGDMRYNGSGMDLAIRAAAGHADWFDFILKILFTSVTLAAGLKGGELVPTFCIGATFGCFVGGLLGLDAGLAAALGLVGLFCCATNSFVSAIALGFELFGLSVVPYVLIICVILLPFSPKNGLLKSRFFSRAAH